MHGILFAFFPFLQSLFVVALVLQQGHKQTLPLATTDIKLLVLQGCPPGTYGATSGATVIDDCLACGPGKYSVASASTCTNCAASKYLGTVGTTAAPCDSCPSHANSPAGSTVVGHCTCNTGFYGDGNVCTVSFSDSIVLVSLSCHKKSVNCISTHWN